ncbi:hypothetical protein DSM101010T_34800 [Desulfovibrio subterraneus]|uniref:Uncharacterized protein n=1 Tax=Desulfovibrio subterraneus TaxID=2718620 RepID=A0A7J0BPP4_9BACT|nr:hypothetical protein DSM101010T_34800 [Desulfovibrio subterraneus]
MDWVVYLVATPTSYEFVNYSSDGLEKYSFPLYLGYIYSPDSKTIKWKSFHGFAEREMRSWSKSYMKYFLNSDYPLFESGRTYWELSDPEFFDAAVLLISDESGMFPIRYERNATIDPDWKPVFPKQYRYTKEDVESGRVKSLPREAFTPLNWDQESYNQRMNKR